MDERSVMLLGYRGSGKSTVGRALAGRLGFGFLDTDALVLDRFGGRSVPEVWAAEGEPAFREVEADVVEAVAGRSGVVLALGGGAVTERARAALAVEASDAWVVFLSASASTLAERISADEAAAGLGGQRPSLSGAGSAAAEVSAVLKEREPTYRRLADAVVDVSASVDEVVEAVLRGMG